MEIVVKKDLIREPKETQLKSFNEVFIHYFGITYNSMEGKLTKFNDNFIRNRFYEKELNEIKELGEGSYGIVFEVKKLNNKITKLEENFAIKRIELRINEPNNNYFSETILKEVANFSVIKKSIKKILLNVMIYGLRMKTTKT